MVGREEGKVCEGGQEFILLGGWSVLSRGARQPSRALRVWKWKWCVITQN